jgi:hypothetical protein
VLRTIQVLWIAIVCLSTPGCRIGADTGKGAATIIGRGVVNNPSNKSLRFDMLKFGMGEFCAELMLRGAPLRLSDGQPVIGRYFAETCNTKSIDTLEKSSVVVQFGGHGFAWTAATGRLGFRVQGLLELAPDFRIREEAMYVYFRPIQVDTSDFELLMTENTLAQAAVNLAGVSEKELGQSIINAQLGRGFTAIRYDADGHTDFALGVVDEGARPFRPFTVRVSPRRTDANGRTEIFSGQQDFLGKIRVKKGDAITLTLRVEGTEGVDFSLISEKAGRPYLDQYIRSAGTQPMQVVPSFQATALSGAPTRAQVRVPSGDYYLVLDHSNAWGAVTPGENSLPARVDYLLQTGPYSDN